MAAKKKNWNGWSTGWLYEAKPDVVHSLECSAAGTWRTESKQRMNITVVCSLQDEEVWVDAMDDHFRKEVWDLMSERGKDVDVFIPVSNYFASEIDQRMTIP